MTVLQKEPPADTLDLRAETKQAQALMRQGRMDEAEVGWRRVLAAQPDSQAAALGLVKTLEARGARDEAEDVLRAFVAAAPAPAHVLAAAQQWEAWQEDPRPGVKTLRVALTGTGTLNPLGAHLRVACAQIGLHPALFVSDFDQWAQDLLAPGSSLYEFGPELIVLLLDPSALFPQTARGDAISADALAAEREAGLAQVAELLAAAGRQAPSATVLMHTFALPDRSPLGVLDLKTEDGQRARFEALNAGLCALVAEKYPKVALFDQERAEARHGKDRIRDDRMWYMASLPFSDSFLPVLAAEYLRFVRPLKGLTRKCIVLDLDNTLWGGVVGEDGFNGIKLGGTSAPGNAFADFQQALDALRRRGVLLALCSKNNPDDVWPVLDSHPGMALRRDCFAAVRVNWQDKATNIAAIARELNIGLDSLVFLDDNPAERGLVRQQLPAVLTVEMPRDPALYTRTLLGLDVFETLALTDEDRRRSALYQEQQERRAFEERLTEEAGDLSAYLHGLQMTVQIAAATPFTLPRIAQLTNKTNQFNVTTRRYTEAQVQAMADDPEQWGVYSVSVADRFGDSGLTGVAITRKHGEAWELDSFLLSCRVLGRGVEDALLAFTARQARAAGASRLDAVFVPTAKNAPAAGFFPRAGFVEVSSPDGPEGAAHWTLPLDAPDLEKFPEWLTLT